MRSQMLSYTKLKVKTSRGCVWLSARQWSVVDSVVTAGGTHMLPEPLPWPDKRRSPGTQALL